MIQDFRSESNIGFDDFWPLPSEDMYLYPLDGDCVAPHVRTVL